VIAAVVLAAGASTRFGSPKQRVLLEPVLERVRASAVDRVVVVLGAHGVETTAETVRCPEWERGPGASLRCGLAKLSADTEAAVVVLADGPDLAPEAIDRVAAAWRASGREVVAATYGGVRGHPVVLARSAWTRVPDEGARGLDALTVPCDDLGAPGDVDVPADLPGRFRPDAAELKHVDAVEHGRPAPATPPAEEAGPRRRGRAR
jgi:CTP:molybdopterin cytidylyltransferase MocA